MKRYETISIAVAIEAGTGLVLISFPSLFVRLLLGVELSEPGQIVGRLAGIRAHRFGAGLLAPRGDGRDSRSVASSAAGL